MYVIVKLKRRERGKAVMKEQKMVGGNDGSRKYLCAVKIISIRFMKLVPLYKQN